MPTASEEAIREQGLGFAFRVYGVGFEVWGAEEPCGLGPFGFHHTTAQ
jgi:hypothetical protein